MSRLDDYIAEFGIEEDQMVEARRNTQGYVDAYNLREARKACNMTQTELARAMGVSQNRVSRMENGDIDSMSLDVLRRYVEALGGHITLTAELPSGTVALA